MLTELLAVERSFAPAVPVTIDDLTRHFDAADIRRALNEGDLVVHNIAPAEAMTCRRRPFVTLSPQGRAKAEQAQALYDQSVAAIRGTPDLVLS